MHARVWKRRIVLWPLQQQQRSKPPQLKTVQAGSRFNSQHNNNNQPAAQAAPLATANFDKQLPFSFLLQSSCG
jgi:hypothetical protein